MRRYNSRILRALVVAYKRGIINKSPLKRWINREEIFYQALKYITYLISFTFLFIILNKELLSIFDLDQDIIIGGVIFRKARLLSGLVLGLISFNLYRLCVFIHQIYTVKKAMKKYIVSNGDVEKVNSITFKIHI